MDGEFSSAVFSPGNSANSVRTTRTEWDSFEVLSLTGLNASHGIHAGYDDIENLTVMLGDGADQVRIHDSLGQAGSQVTVLAGGGNDDITLSNTATPINPLSSHEFSVDDFAGHVSIDGGAGANLLLIDDHGDPGDDPNGDTITQEFSGEFVKLTGMGANEFASIFYRASNGGDFSRGLEIITSSGSDKVSLNAIYGGDHTILRTGAGNDDVIVGNFIIDPAALLTIYSGANDDLVDALASPVWVTVYGAGGSDAIYGSEFDDFLYEGDGNNLIIGNLGEDFITAESGNDIVIGDHGYVHDADGDRLTPRNWPQIAEVASTSGSGPGADIISVGDGDNVVIGGAGADSITAGIGTNTILGDDGRVTFDADGNFVLAESINPLVGDKDTFTLGKGTKASGRKEITRKLG